MENRQPLLRVRPTAAPAPNAPPVASVYRACCTSVPYLLSHRTVPVVPAYRACCTTVPYPVYPRDRTQKKGRNVWKKGSNVECQKRRFTVNLQCFAKKRQQLLKKAAFSSGTVGWYDWYGQLVRLVRSAGATGTFGWYDWYGLLVRLVRLVGTTGKIGGYDC